MSTSQNGFPALDYGSRLLYTWTIPAKNGTLKLTLRNGSAGFVLVHFLVWFSETIEDLTGAHPADDWGFAPRPIRGSSTTLSNHASATAADTNATEHPLGVRGTLTIKEKAKIWLRLKVYRGVLRHGAFYNGRVDEMHVEINAPMSAVEKVAYRLMETPRGKRILAANPSQRAVILS